MMETQFHGFPQLPPELRNMIWEYALPASRVFEVLDAPNAKQKTPAQQGLIFANIHSEPPPTLAAVCAESRSLVMYRYKTLTLGATTKYVDLSRDLLLLEPYLMVKRLHRTLRFMSQIPMLRDNISQLAMGTSYGVYTGVYHPVLSWKLAKNNIGKLLQRLEDFPRLKKIIFIVHQEFQFEFDTRKNPPRMEYPAQMTAVQAIAPIPFSRPSIYPPSNTSSHPPPPPPPPILAQIPMPRPMPWSMSWPLCPISQLPSPPMTPPFRSDATTPTSHAIPLTASAYCTDTRRLAAMPLPALPLPMPLTPPPYIPATQQQRPILPAPVPLHAIVIPPVISPPRPQLIHQAYRFKFDIESRVNHSARMPHTNEIGYYPPEADQDKLDGEAVATGFSCSKHKNDDSCCWDCQDDRSDSKWCEPGPTKDDWTRFRRRFVRAVRHTIEMGVMSDEDPDIHARISEKYGSPVASDPIKLDRNKVPAFEGASLLWRYKDGAYI